MSPDSVIDGVSYRQAAKTAVLDDLLDKTREGISKIKPDPGLQDHTAAMAKIVADLSAKINAVDSPSSDHALIPRTKNPLSSVAFLAPALGVMGVVAASIWLLGTMGVLKSNTIVVLTDIVGAALVLQVLASNIRNWQLQKAITAQSKLAVKDELRLERARAALFNSATDELQGHLFAITSAVPKGKMPEIDSASQELITLLDRMSLIAALTTRGADYMLNTEYLEVSSHLANLIAEVKPEATRQKVEIDLLSPEKLRFKLDPLLFTQAIRPALDNAIKFSGGTDGGGKVTVTAQKHHKGLVISVRDNGPGIAPRRRPQLFKPFSRGEDALRFNYEGAGLGLYLVSLATGLLGGEVEIDEHMKQGTELRWYFDKLEVADDGPAKKLPEVAIPLVDQPLSS